MSDTSVSLYCGITYKQCRRGYHILNSIGYSNKLMTTSGH